MSDGLPSYADRLCSPCRAAMERSIADGTRRSSVCNDCADRLLEGARVVKTETVGGDSTDIVGTPLEFVEAPMRAPVDHPPPWSVSLPPHTFVRDALGQLVFATVSHDPYIRELLRAAPEMERLLRKIGGRLDPDTGWCPGCTPYLSGEHDHKCEVIALIARLDEARDG